MLIKILFLNLQALFEQNDQTLFGVRFPTTFARAGVELLVIQVENAMTKMSVCALKKNSKNMSVLIRYL
jgi:hypothetical protein